MVDFTRNSSDYEFKSKLYSQDLLLKSMKKKGTGRERFTYFCPDAYRNEVIIEASIHSCRLYHGSYSWLFSFGKAVVTIGQAPSLEHHWAILKTNEAYYTIQHKGNEITCVRELTLDMAINQGCLGADRRDTPEVWRE